MTSLTDLELESSYQFVVSNGWSHRIKDFDEWCKIIKNSQRVIVAMDSGHVIGFARGITDEASNGYLSMVVVADEYRKQGIGRALVHKIIGDDSGITWVLRAGRDGAAEFFAKLGFASSTVAMERSRIVQ